MWILSQQVIPNQALITNIWQMKSNWAAQGWQLYIGAARQGSCLQSAWLLDSQPAESAGGPRRAFHPGASALLSLHTHPSCLVRLSNPQPPSLPSSFPPASLLPLHWACEGEPVPSGATVQIAMLPLQIETSLLWIPVALLLLLLLSPLPLLWLFSFLPLHSTHSDVVLILSPSRCQVSCPWPWPEVALAAPCVTLELLRQPGDSCHSMTRP